MRCKFSSILVRTPIVVFSLSCSVFYNGPGLTRDRYHNAVPKTINIMGLPVVNGHIHAVSATF